MVGFTTRNNGRVAFSVPLRDAAALNDLGKSHSRAWIAYAFRTIVALRIAYSVAKSLLLTHAEDDPGMSDAARYRELAEQRRRTLILLAVPILIGALSVAGYGFATSWTRYIVAATIGSAALAGGALIGFLFGIPRALTSETATLVEPAAHDPAAPQYQVNTNLEQVSDWLTKILIGVSLAQANDIIDGFKDLTMAVQPALGGTDTARVFAGALIVYYVISGFLCSYLYTRLRLQQDLEMTIYRRARA